MGSHGRLWRHSIIRLRKDYSNSGVRKSGGDRETSGSHRRHPGEKQGGPAQWVPKQAEDMLDAGKRWGMSDRKEAG